MSITKYLKMIHSNFSIGLFSFSLLNRLKLQDIPTKDRTIIGEDGLYCVPRDKEVPTEAGNFYEIEFGGSPDFNLKRANMEFAKMLLRNFTLDNYEALLRYCRGTNQLSKLKTQSWFEFVRILRNSLTHTQTFRFNKYDLSKLPVTWRNKKIEAGMDGQELSFEFYDWWDGCELWEEMFAFAKTLN